MCAAPEAANGGVVGANDVVAWNVDVDVAALPLPNIGLDLLDADADAFKALAKDISMHIAASNPLVVSSDDLDQALRGAVRDTTPRAAE